MASNSTRDANLGAGIQSGLTYKEKIKFDSSGANDPKTMKPKSPPKIPAGRGHTIR